MPAELTALIGRLSEWGGGRSEERNAPQQLSRVVVGGRFAQAAYRMQLLPLLGDAQARTLQGLTGDFARLPWHAEFLVGLETVDDVHVAAISAGELHPHTGESA